MDYTMSMCDNQFTQTSLYVVAKFEKVSYKEFKKAYLDALAYNGKTDTRLQNRSVSEDMEEHIKQLYDEIKLPTRATDGSAGYDFYFPLTDEYVDYSSNRLFPTGIRCKIKPGFVLMLYPRSGLGFKFGFRLMNTTGVIDSDYYYANNEGHIMAKVESNVPVMIHHNDRFMQGVFTQFFLAEEEAPNTKRTGGFGSTDK